MQQHSIWFGMDQRQHGELVISTSKPSGYTKCLGEESVSHINPPRTWQLIAWQRDWVQAASLRSWKTYVSLTTNPPSHSLSRECQVSNYFNVYTCLPHVEQRFHLSMSILFSMYIWIHQEYMAVTMFGWFESMLNAWCHPPISVEWWSDWDRIMRACSAWQCGLAISWPIHDSTVRSVPIRGQPPPVSVECMSQREPSMESTHGCALSMVYGICCMYVYCMLEPLVVQTLLLPFRLCQIVDLAVRNGCSKVLMSVWWHWHCCNQSSLRTCASMVTTLTTLMSILFQLQSSWGWTVLTISLSQQMWYSFPFMFSFVQSMPHSGSDSRLWIQQVCVLSRTDC